MLAFFDKLPPKECFLEVNTRNDLPPIDEACICLCGVSPKALAARLEECKLYADQLITSLSNGGGPFCDVQIKPIFYFDHKQTANTFLQLLGGLQAQDQYDLIYELQRAVNEPWGKVRMITSEDIDAQLDAFKIWCFQNDCASDFAAQGKALYAKQLRQQEFAIFDAWKRFSLNPGQVVTDGIIHTDAYLTPGQKKILFVLRDKNGPVSDSYREAQAYPNHFRKELADIGSGARTWNNVARWGQAILHPDLEYDQLRSLSGAERAKALHPFACINLKKEYGTARTDRSSLDRIAKHPVFASLLQEQIALYDADLIIACGMRSGGHDSNMQLLSKLLGIGQEDCASVRLQSRSYRYRIWNNKGKEVPVIEFYHPQVTAASAFPGLRGHALWKELFEDIKALSTRLSEGGGD